jgi:phosphohistidine phosphatase SixA
VCRGLQAVGEKQAVEVSATPKATAAKAQLELVVASPLSRALRTADLVFPIGDGSATSEAECPRVVLEPLREYIGHVMSTCSVVFWVTNFQGLLEVLRPWCRQLKFALLR